MQIDSARFLHAEHCAFRIDRHVQNIKHSALKEYVPFVSRETSIGILHGAMQQELCGAQR
jgi:hypothetical protein